jgi:hypothetical protein
VLVGGKGDQLVRLPVAKATDRCELLKIYRVQMNVLWQQIQFCTVIRDRTG